MFVQKRGICIGSRVAPVLCDMFLAFCDRAIADKMEHKEQVKIFRYVDDFLVLTSKPVDLSDEMISGMLKLFTRCAFGLSFTHETACSGRLQFLDLGLSFGEDHVCWAYEPRSKKGMLPYDSAHSKLVNRGIASTCLAASLKESCTHRMSDSFHAQLSRLEAAGFPPSVLLDVSETILKKIKNRSREDSEDNIRRAVRPAVLPYIHRLSHNLKKVAKRVDVKVVYSAPEKLAKMCKLTDPFRKVPTGCPIRHRSPFVTCSEGVVYQIPLSCGKKYIGQTGRCLNVRLREHHQKVNGVRDGHLSCHCQDAGANLYLHQPLFLLNTEIGLSGR
ncbi:unnamed protein product [Ixodes hexagonus]